MASTHPSDYNADAALIGFAVDYRLHNEQHFADKLFPFIQVDKEAGEFKVLSAEDFFRDEIQKVPDGEPVPIIGRSFTADTYQTAVYGGRAFVSRREMNNAGKTGIDPGRMAMKTIMKKIMLHRDIAFSSKFFPTGASTLWGTGDDYTKDFITAERWDKIADATPGDVMKFVKQARRRVQGKSGDLPNVMLVGAKTWDVLSEHEEITDKIKFTQKGVITEELIASLFMIDKVIIAEAPYNDAAEGATRTIKRHGDTSVLFVYANNSAPNQNDGASAGYCFEMVDEGTPYIPGGGGMMIRSYYSNEKRGTYYEVILNYVMKIVDTNRSLLWTNVVAA